MDLGSSVVHTIVVIEAVVFDVDGVLVDSIKANQKFFEDILVEAGYEKPDPDELLQYFHLSMYDALKKLTKQDDPDEIARVWRLGNGAVRYPFALVIYPRNLKEIMRRLSGLYLLGIATSRIEKGMTELLAQADIGRYFKAVVTYEDYVHSKPNPEPLLVAASRLGVNPERAIYIGDSPSDIEAAFAAGMKSIQLSSSPNGQANISVETFDNLPRAIEELATACMDRRNIGGRGLPENRIYKATGIPDSR